MTLGTIRFETAAERLYDVVVVGAGPAGSVAALQIARRGMSVLLVDRYEFPRDKLCGACLNGAAVKVLRELRLGEQLEELEGVPLNEFELRSGTSRLCLPIRGGIAVRRSRLDTMLVQAAIDAGTDFLGGTTLNISAPADETCRLLTRRYDDTAAPLRAKIVVAASGLSSDRKPDDAALATQPSSGTRFGAGTTARQFPDYYRSGTIFMAAGKNGYVGLTRVEDGSLNIAAALDRSAVGHSSPAVVCREIVENSGFPVCDVMLSGHWKGTTGLTRRTRKCGSQRLFVVGDAAGYVEPFTGEGMAWSITGAQALAPIIERGAKQWDAGLISDWNGTLTQLVTNRQRWCRRLATVLRYPKLVRGMMGVVSAMPAIGRALARRIHEAN